MDIILDTNVFREDFWLQSHKSALLLDYLRKTGGRIIMPQIVWEEVGALFKRELLENLHKFASARRDVEKVLNDSIPETININPDAEVKRYREFLMARLNFTEESVVPYLAEYLQAVVMRAINRVKPCSEKGEEIRDAILWLTVMDIARGDGDYRAVFISRNTKQFADENKELHRTLREEAEREGLEIKYYFELGKFISAHAATVNYVTKDWLLENVSLDEIKSEMLERVESEGHDRLIDWAVQRCYQPTGHLSVKGADIELDNYYVYEMTSGEFKIEVMYAGTLQIEFEMFPERRMGAQELDDRDTDSRIITLNPQVKVDAEVISSGETEGVRHVVIYGVEY